MGTGRQDCSWAALSVLAVCTNELCDLPLVLPRIAQRELEQLLVGISTGLGGYSVPKDFFSGQTRASYFFDHRLGEPEPRARRRFRNDRLGGMVDYREGYRHDGRGVLGVTRI